MSFAGPGSSLRWLIFGISGIGLAAVALPMINAAAQVQPDLALASPIFGVSLPDGYRDWKLVSVAHEAGRNNDIRAILGNETAVKSFRDGTRPFPDGTVIVRLAWQYQSSPRNDAVFPAPQSFVAGPPTNVQVSVKDSKRYSTTAGWGYGQFEGGKANKDASLVQTCFGCHAKLEKSADLVFTQFAP